jgi:hydrogenase nickel incorporation protein HypA/HybF
MHEQSLARAMLRKIEAEAAARPAGRVVAIRVRIGEFSSVEPELLCAAFDSAVAETALAGVELDLQVAPLQAHCKQCGLEFSGNRYHFTCPVCGSSRLAIQGGEELQIVRIETEEAEPCATSM